MTAQRGSVAVARISTRSATTGRNRSRAISARYNYSYFLESPNAITHAFFMINYFVLCARQATAASLASASSSSYTSHPPRSPASAPPTQRSVGVWLHKYSHNYRVCIDLLINFDLKFQLNVIATHARTRGSGWYLCTYHNWLLRQPVVMGGWWCIAYRSN